MRTGGVRELASVLVGALVLTVVLTYPIAFKLGHVGRVDNADGQVSIWNIAWVARTLVVDPLHVFDANIFYPHRGTLAYSEGNLGGGALAIPVYWATRNAYAAHNFVLLLTFVLSVTGTYYLVRHLAADRRAAAVSAISFGFCPYVFAHMSHIQLEMTAGLPLVMLALHRLADRPTAGRGVALGTAMAVQAICCGYYGVFAIMLVGYGVIVLTTTRQLWTNRDYWIAITSGAVVAVAIVLPAFEPYLALRRNTGFHRSLADASSFSATWGTYLASAAYAHAWMLRFLPRWHEVAFPGFVAVAFGVPGLWVARRSRRGEIAWLYGGIVLLSLWASFGPSAGAYTVFYNVIPGFGWLRAPERFGVLVDFGLVVLASIGVAGLLETVRHAAMIAAVLIAIAVAEHVVPLHAPDAIPVEPVYKVLAALPRGPVIEMPFYYPQVGLYQHAIYMLKSTAHWMPMVNGYSDYIPQDFHDHVMTLAPFPSRDAFKILEPNRVRYAVFHMYGYNDENRRDVIARLKQFDMYLRPVFVDEGTRLYEIVGFPP